jgi:peptidase M23-like protein
MRRLLLLVVLAALIIPCTASAWTWPVDGPVLRPFRFGSDPYAGGQHRGIDVGAPVGSLVAAPAGGTVSFTGSVPGGGGAVTIRTADGFSVTLLQLGSISVLRGSTVPEGVVVGTVGESVDAVTHAAHVHLGVRYTTSENGYVDPLSLLPPRAAVASPAEDPPATPVTTAVAPPPAASGADAGVAGSAEPNQDAAAAETLSEEPAPTGSATDAVDDTIADGADEPSQAEQAERPEEPAAPAPGAESAHAVAPEVAEQRDAAGDAGADAAASAVEAAAPISPAVDAAPDPPLDAAPPAAVAPTAAASSHPPPDATAVTAPPPAMIEAHGPPLLPALVAPMPLPPLPLPAWPARLGTRPATHVSSPPVVSGSSRVRASRTVNVRASALRIAPHERRPLLARSDPSLPARANAHGRRTYWLAALLSAVVLAACALAGRRSRKRPRIMAADAELTGEAPCGGRVAVRLGAETYRPRGGLRRPVRRVRPLPAATRERRPDGEWNRRARDSRDGRRGSRRRVRA